ncbi:hypothetical protein HYH03_008446 [Edaphochlamys debaryana]|uniref:Protein kinase domain-containing protein n=1 Tax=Edaphochlamys debaryana TaxID=47281 RepID=A0A835Y387_9CHLO|nr:hypothetical protein HYH03_008446 [Edaphochlamys debaryana]|eukprot:KAG2493311.1 hypothetical protein HYH03_008446 [Edaphochlamys debaryana]
MDIAARPRANATGFPPAPTDAHARDAVNTAGPSARPPEVTAAQPVNNTIPAADTSGHSSRRGGPGAVSRGTSLADRASTARPSSPVSSELVKGSNSGVALSGGAEAPDGLREAQQAGCLPRWLAQLCGGGGGGGGGRRRARTNMSAATAGVGNNAGAPSLASLASPARRSNPSAGHTASTSGYAAQSTGTSNDSHSHLGPLPSSRVMQVLPSRSGSFTAAAGQTAATATGQVATGQGPGHGAPALAPHLRLTSADGGAATGTGNGTSSNGGSGGGATGNTGGVSVTSGGVPTSGGAGHGGGANGAAGNGSAHANTGQWVPVGVGLSRASSLASHTSGVTTTSRPSRWGILANIITAGLRSFSQLAGLVEPGTGSLRREAVSDLARRASALDVVRAVGQVADQALVGTGSAGLVYRGTTADGAAVCVKYVISRGLDNMAAPATEGLLSRALTHPNIVLTLSWHVAKVTAESFMDLPDALNALTKREAKRAAKRARRGGGKAGKKQHRHGGNAGGGGGGGGSMWQSNPSNTPAGGSNTAGSTAASQPLPSYGGAATVTIATSAAVAAAAVASRRRRSSGTIVSLSGGGFASNVLELVRGSNATGPRTDRSRSGQASPLGRGGLYGSFSVHGRGSAVGGGGGRDHDAAAPLLSMGPADPNHRRPSVPESLYMRTTDMESSWSARRGEAFYLAAQSDVSASILAQAAACDAAAAAAAGNGGGAPTSGMTGWLTRDNSLSGHWFGPSPNVSHHTYGGSQHHHHAPHVGPAYPYSGTAGGVNPGAAGGGGGLFGGLHAYGPAPVPPLQTWSAGGTAGAAGGGGGGGGPAAGPPIRPMRTGSRLQFGTSSVTHPSIPEDTQACDVYNDPSGYGGSMYSPNPGGSMHGPGGSGYHPAGSVHGPGGSMHGPGGGLQQHSSLTSPSLLGHAGRPLPGHSHSHGHTHPYHAGNALAISVPAPDHHGHLLADHLATSCGGEATASSSDVRGHVASAIAAVACASPASAAITIGNHAHIAMAVAESIGGSGGSAADSAILSANGTLSPRARGRDGRNGSLIGALGSRASSHALQLGLALGLGSVRRSGSGPRGTVGAATSGLLSDMRTGTRSDQPPTANNSRTGSTALTRTTTASSKRLSSAATTRGLLQMVMAAAPLQVGGAAASVTSGGGGGGITGSNAAGSTPVAGSSEPGSVLLRSGESPCLIGGGGGGGGILAPATAAAARARAAAASGDGGSSLPRGGGGAADTSTGPSGLGRGSSSGPAAAMLSSGHALSVAAAEAAAEAARHEALERGWGTLRSIMSRLDAKPGDYLTRIVMEEADQGSLLTALKAGRFRGGSTAASRHGSPGPSAAASFAVSGASAAATPRAAAGPAASVGPSAPLLHVLLTALDVASGMAYLHGHSVLHGDLKPSNILLRSSAGDPRGFVAKVSDFGLSRLLTRDTESVHNPEPYGTVRYLAPETVSGSSFHASDVWSFGVVMWQLVTGEVAPWPSLRNMQILMGVMHGELRLTVPPSTYPPLAHLLEGCLAHDHTQRPAFQDIVDQLQAMIRDLSRAQTPASSGVGAHISAAGSAGRHISGASSSTAAGRSQLTPLRTVTALDLVDSQLALVGGALERLPSNASARSGAASDTSFGYPGSQPRSEGRATPAQLRSQGQPEEAAASEAPNSKRKQQPRSQLHIELMQQAQQQQQQQLLAAQQQAAAAATAVAASVAAEALASAAAQPAENVDSEAEGMGAMGVLTIPRFASPSIPPVGSVPEDGPLTTAMNAATDVLDRQFCALPSIGSSATLTAAASSQHFTAMSSSWANTERDGRSTGAWASGNNWAGTQGLHTGMLPGSSVGHSRGLAPSTGANTNGGGNTGALTMERHCLQELFSRHRASLDALPDDVGPGGSSTGRSPSGSALAAAASASASMRFGSGSIAGGAATPLPGGSSSAQPPSLGPVTSPFLLEVMHVHGPHAHGLLPPVHEEGYPTDPSSSSQPINVPGSGSSNVMGSAGPHAPPSFATGSSAGDRRSGGAAGTGAVGGGGGSSTGRGPSGDLRGRPGSSGRGAGGSVAAAAGSSQASRGGGGGSHVSSAQGSGGGRGGEAGGGGGRQPLGRNSNLPRMLQAGLIVLGRRRSSAAYSLASGESYRPFSGASQRTDDPSNH